MIPLHRRIRQLWRRIFPPRAIRIPGKFPWKQPAPLPFGTILIHGNPPIVADGKGGVMVAPAGTFRVYRSGELGARRPKIG